MSKYIQLQESLSTSKTGKIKVYGNSMIPLIYSGATLTYGVKEQYEVGDIVFCKIKGHWIDAHKITKIDNNKGYMIANNHGFENGWTRTIFGYVTNIEY